MLANQQKITCIKCGFCCKLKICEHGTWNLEETECIFLEFDRSCYIYPLIKSNKKIFGWGCFLLLFFEELKLIQTELETLFPYL